MFSVWNNFGRIEFEGETDITGLDLEKIVRIEERQSLLRRSADDSDQVERRFAREAANLMSCQNNLKQVGLALHNYHDTFLRFPAAIYFTDGNTIQGYNQQDNLGPSWLVGLLPYFDQAPLYARYQFNQKAAPQSWQEC